MSAETKSKQSVRGAVLGSGSTFGCRGPCAYYPFSLGVFAVDPLSCRLFLGGVCNQFFELFSRFRFRFRFAFLSSARCSLLLVGCIFGSKNIEKIKTQKSFFFFCFIIKFNITFIVAFFLTRFNVFRIGGWGSSWGSDKWGSDRWGSDRLGVLFIILCIWILICTVVYGAAPFDSSLFFRITIRFYHLDTIVGYFLALPRLKIE